MHRILFLQPVRKTSVRSSCRRIGVAAAVVVWAAVALLGRIATANFDVHGASSARAEAIVQNAEEVRERAFAALLDTSAPAPWTIRCEIHLHATEESFAEAVGGPPDGARGATAIEFAETGVCVRRIDLMDDDPAAVPDALAHELVHVILADHFTAAGSSSIRSMRRTQIPASANSMAVAPRAPSGGPPTASANDSSVA